MKNRFIEKSIFGAISFLKESIFAEEYASKKRLLQLLDPRLKVLASIFMIVAVMFMTSVFPILMLYFMVLLLVQTAGIGMVYFLKRTWIFIPLFSLFIAIPAVFSIFSPGSALAGFDLFGMRLVVTRQGVAAATLFLSRVITSVSVVVLLGLTTRHAQILRALRVFGIPQVFIMTIGMCYRYIYLLLKTIEETHLAIKTRTPQEVCSVEGQRVVSWSVASLWSRSYQLQKEVFNAMVARGYGGED